MLTHASPPQLLAAACAGDRDMAQAVVNDHPNVIARLTRAQHAAIATWAHANDTRAVLLMLELGFDALATGGVEG